MNLMPLANLLQAQGVGTKGVSLFVNMMPNEAESAILLRDPLSGTKINYELPGFYQTEFQVIVRSHSYVDGGAIMTAACAALTMKSDRQVEDHSFKYCRPRTNPSVFPLSKGNLLEFSVMFDTCFVKDS